MSRLKTKTPGQLPGRGAVRGGTDKIKSTTDYNRKLTPLSRPKLTPQEAALIRLDSVEARLAAARAAKDDDTWARYYQAWLCLHRVAFFSGGASDV